MDNNMDFFTFNYQYFNHIMKNMSQNTVINFMTRILLAGFHLWISSVAIVWSSIFIYLVFYYAYIPVVSTSKEVYIQYDSRCDANLRDNSCHNPMARVDLRHGRSTDFVRGQTYKFTIDLHLPESDVNWNQGLFMVRLRLLDQKRQIGVDLAKPTGLKYKSAPLRLIITLLYWPLFVMGLADEKQIITVNLIEDFIEGSYQRVGPITDAIIEFEARDIQIYPPTVLKVSAELTGLRFFMHNHWLLSFCAGTSTIAFFLYMMTAIGLANYYFAKNHNQFTHDLNFITNNATNDGLNEEIDREMIEDINEELNRELIYETNVRTNESLDEECDKLESELTGDVMADSTGSEGSSTLVIAEIDEIDNQFEDMDQTPDSSVG